MVKPALVWYIGAGVSISNFKNDLKESTPGYRKIVVLVTH